MSAGRRRRRWCRWLLPCLVVGPLLVTRGLAGQAGGGMLFSYEPHAGERASFEEGYRSHLEWHREKRDSLPWYGWDVLAGARLGQFVDGTFGIRFEALDRRVDPGGDAAHASQSYADHAIATGRWAVRLRPELSTATPLEDRAPAPLVQVVTYTLPLGYQARFEAVLRQVRERAPETGLVPYTVYESVVGGSDAELTVMVWRNGFAGFERADRDPAVAIRRMVSGELGTALRAESELWRLREDLTLLPDREEASSEGEAAGTAGGERGAWRTTAPVRRRAPKRLMVVLQSLRSPQLPVPRPKRHLVIAGRKAHPFAE